MDLVGVDGLRLLPGARGASGPGRQLCHEALVNRYNYDLANDLGNLVHRTVSMLQQLFDGVLPEELAVSDLDEAIESRRKSACMRRWRITRRWSSARRCRKSGS